MAVDRDAPKDGAGNSEWAPAAHNTRAIDSAQAAEVAAQEHNIRGAVAARNTLAEAHKQVRHNNRGYSLKTRLNQEQQRPGTNHHPPRQDYSTQQICLQMPQIAVCDEEGASISLSCGLLEPSDSSRYIPLQISMGIPYSYLTNPIPQQETCQSSNHIFQWVKNTPCSQITTAMRPKMETIGFLSRYLVAESF
ncbi:hypothetical protein [Acidithiobacillus sp.]|jgi:hypothetical protein|uniref:hypothetical protein n=1 Tax=Acidithiobacillus sp. TaxID=1872118 RepID=UPI002328A411|nr:hypothetical protein [Acidithiobacillus sp.]